MQIISSKTSVRKVLRPALERRGLTSGADLCDLALRETGVALMAGCPAFLAPPGVLTARLCFVDFDGAPALEESRRLGLEKPLPEDFVARRCARLHDGIEVRLLLSAFLCVLVSV